MHVLARSILITAVLAGCSADADDRPDGTSDGLTRAQRDSVIGASRLPGAGGVRRALEIGDTAAARQAITDSLLRD
jgi:hypothetical protein